MSSLPVAYQPCVDGNFSPVALGLPANLSEKEWIDIGKKLVPLAQASQWWIGDWILYGERLYGKRRAYELAQQETGYSKNTLYQYARIAERIEPVRRVQQLAFSVHRAVECLPPKDQELFLTEAAIQGYGEEELRDLVSRVETPTPVRRVKELDSAGRYRKLHSLVKKLYASLPQDQREAELRQHLHQLMEEYCGALEQATAD